jgi:hypothetical protein
MIGIESDHIGPGTGTQIGIGSQGGIRKVGMTPDLTSRGMIGGTTGTGGDMTGVIDGTTGMVGVPIAIVNEVRPVDEKMKVRGASGR